jgi:hypothetical protein
MQKQFSATLCAVSAASIIALVVTLLPGMSARAATECLAAPKGTPGAGQHWWYRRDRATGRQCWYLGPKDSARAAMMARAEATPADGERPRPAATPQTMRTASAANVEPEDEAPGGRASGLAYLLDWSDLLRAAGMIAAKPATGADNLTDEERARSAQTTGAPSEEAQAPLPAPAAAAALAPEDRTTGPFVQMLLIVGAALLIAGAIWQAIFSLGRWLRERPWRRRERRTRPVPAEMQPRDLAAPPPANMPGRRPRPADPYGPFDADELQRVLDRLRSAA